MPGHKLMLSELPDLFDAVSQVTGKEAKIGVADPAVSRYVRVLEYGSIQGQKPWPHPGPRTLLAQDPETGAAIVVAAQAPHGFIRVNAAAFLRELSDRAAGPVDWLQPEDISEHLARVSGSAAQAILERLRHVIPKGRGRLQESLRVLDG